MYCIHYKVKKEDTLYRISRHFNVTLQIIMAANPLVDVYALKEGVELLIPVSVPEESYKGTIIYTTKGQDSLGDLLDEYCITLADLVEFNELDQLYLESGIEIKIPIKNDWMV